MSRIIVTHGSATVELDAIVESVTTSGKATAHYQAADLLAAASRALHAAGETILADAVHQLWRQEP